MEPKLHLRQITNQESSNSTGESRTWPFRHKLVRKPSKSAQASRTLDIILHKHSSLETETKSSNNLTQVMIIPWSSSPSWSPSLGTPWSPPAFAACQPRRCLPPAPVSGSTHGKSCCRHLPADHTWVPQHQSIHVIRISKLHNTRHYKSHNMRHYKIHNMSQYSAGN